MAAFWVQGRHHHQCSAVKRLVFHFIFTGKKTTDTACVKFMCKILCMIMVIFHWQKKKTTDTACVKFEILCMIMVIFHSTDTACVKFEILCMIMVIFHWQKNKWHSMCKIRNTLHDHGNFSNTLHNWQKTGKKTTDTACVKFKILCMIMVIFHWQKNKWHSMCQIRNTLHDHGKNQLTQDV